MSLLILVFGIFLLCLVLIDALWTTLWTEGVAGPLSYRLSRYVWLLWSKLFIKRRNLLSAAGPLIMMSVVAMWVVLMWLAWALIFSADASSLANTEERTDPGMVGRVYFAAMAIFTMGNGDVSPQTGAWRIATALANANGFLVLTLMISYVMSVLPAVVHKRLVARQILALGESGPEIIEAAWNGKDCSSLELPLNTVSTALEQLTQQHLAYPVLHYFQSVNKTASAVVAIAALEDTVDLLEHGVIPGHGISEISLRSTRSALDSFVSTIVAMPVPAPSNTPPAAELQHLKSAGVPVVDTEKYCQDLKQREKVRSRINGNAQESGWEWPHPQNQTEAPGKAESR